VTLIPERFAAALTRLINDPHLRRTLGTAGQKRLLERYSYDVYQQNLYTLYDELETGGSTKM
jgi:hypothetical protein